MELLRSAGGGYVTAMPMPGGGEATRGSGASVAVLRPRQPADPQPLGYDPVVAAALRSVARARPRVEDSVR
jgi:hypothetical protein